MKGNPNARLPAKSEQEAAQVATEGIKARALMHGQAVNHDIASMKLQERLLDTKGKQLHLCSSCH